jgi:hypothetical protein
VVAPPLPGRELRPQPLHRVDLHDDDTLEVLARVEVQVLVGGPGEAVMTDDAVGDEVARSGRDVEHGELDAEILD